MSEQILVNDLAALYDLRYTDGYMEDWSDDKKNRVVELIGTVGLPKAPTVCDFGCGRASFAAALKHSHPSWKVVGYEISEVAVAKNRDEFPNIYFPPPSSPPAGPFDLVYTHHVLEHTEEVEPIVRQIAQMVQPGGKVLHMLPCGNDGSFEKKVALLVRGGIDGEHGGRFYYEEPAHLRRLTSDQLITMSRRFGLEIGECRYANQFWGGIEFLTQHKPQLLVAWLNPLKGASLRSGLRLLGLLILLLPTALLRLPRRIVQAAISGRKRMPLPLVSLALVIWPISYLLDVWLTKARDREWRTKQTDAKGSEMYLLFVKS